MSNSLYVVGNGFDLHHGIQSRYSDFGGYLQKVDPSIYSEVETYFSIDDDFWWQFEAQLATFNVDQLIDDASEFLTSYAAEEWRDSANHDYQFELNRVVTAISVTIRAHFATWIQQLHIPASSALGNKRVPLDANARYLNFNYTQTLQQTYGIAKGNILHIHGCAGAGSELVLGHAWKRAPNDSANYGLDPVETDIRVLQGNDIIDEYFSKTFKPTDRIIASQAAYFESLHDTKRIFVMGHSLSDVDAPYFREIIKNIDADIVRWKISYFGDMSSAKDNFSKLGIDMSLATFSLLDEF